MRQFTAAKSDKEKQNDKYGASMQGMSKCTHTHTHITNESLNVNGLMRAINLRAAGRPVGIAQLCEQR